MPRTAASLAPHPSGRPLSSRGGLPTPSPSDIPVHSTGSPTTPSHGGPSDNPISEPPSPPNTTKRRNTKRNCIEDLGALHKEMMRYDYQIFTNYEPHTWRSQRPTYDKLVEVLITMKNRFEAMKAEVGFEVKKGENGFENYYEYLWQREKLEVVGAVRRAEEWLQEVRIIFAAMKDLVKGRDCWEFSGSCGFIMEGGVIMGDAEEIGD